MPLALAVGDHCNVEHVSAQRALDGVGRDVPDRCIPGGGR